MKRNNKISCSSNAAVLVIAFTMAFAAIGCKKDEPEPEPDSRSYSFTVSRSSSTVSSANVSIATNGQNFSATTGSDGKCNINIPNSITLPTYTIVTVDHSSIKPYCLTVSGAQNANSSIPINCTDVPSLVRFRSVDLHHVGNDIYTAAGANSQLQLPSEGLEKSFSYNLPATPGIMPHIQIYARGIENSLDIISNGIQTGSLNPSSTSGDLSRYDFQLSGNASTIFHPGNNVLTIKSGATGLSNDPWDDIEFCGILLYY